MALSIAELELQSVDYLPAREVMGKCGRKRHSSTTLNYQDNSVSQSQSGIGNVQVGVSALNFQSN